MNLCNLKSRHYSKLTHTQKSNWQTINIVFSLLQHVKDTGHNLHITVWKRHKQNKVNKTKLLALSERAQTSAKADHLVHIQLQLYTVLNCIFSKL